MDLITILEITFVIQAIAVCVLGYLVYAQYQGNKTKKVTKNKAKK